MDTHPAHATILKPSKSKQQGMTPSDHVLPKTRATPALRNDKAQTGKRTYHIKDGKD